MFGPSRRLLLAMPAVGLLAVGLLITTANPGKAHEAPTGWEYPYSCCANQDCREVSKAAISERPEGYVINQTGEVVNYHDKRLRRSPDGRYHWCSVAGSDTSRTICLFVPLQLY
ncbi:hypothetical protein L598_000400001050 [Mesorhizobium sp. J18]|nr:hypothetical protein L598_000400001050 [Mesorhizobium sp. J18]